MFALLRQLTQLDDDHVFADDQGKKQWPAIVAYADAPAFDVSVRFLDTLNASTFNLIFSISRWLALALLTFFPCLQCAVETCGYHVSSGISDGAITSEA